MIEGSTSQSLLVPYSTQTKKRESMPSISVGGGSAIKDNQKDSIPGGGHVFKRITEWSSSTKNPANERPLFEIPKMLS